MTSQQAPQEPNTTGDGYAQLIQEIRLLVDLLAEHAAPWLDEVAAAGHGPAAHPGAEPAGGRGPDAGVVPEAEPGADAEPGSDAGSEPGAQAPGESAPDVGPGAGSSVGQDSGWCPLCAILAVVRGQRPDCAARLAEQAARLVALLRALLADRWSRAEPYPAWPDAGLATEAEESAARSGGRRVQHVPVRPATGTAE